MEEDNGVALLGSTEGESIVRNESAIRDIVQNYQNAPNITVRVVPVLTDGVKYSLSIEASGSATGYQRQGYERTVKGHTHSMAR